MAGFSKNQAERRAITIKQVINDLRPPQPPCFHDLLSWHEYLASAIETQMGRCGRVGPLIVKGHSISKDRLDPSWSYCSDCAYTDDERAQMVRERRCDPEHWARHVRSRDE